MLIGEYTHNLDTKKRLSLPKKFRTELGKKVVVTRGLDNCLFMYSMSAWKETAQRLQSLSFAQADTRGFNRFMLAGAVEIDIDSVGRILVPEYLKKFAGLTTKVVFAGVHDRVEMWDEKVWIRYKAKIEKQADAMAEKLGEIGAL